MLKTKKPIPSDWLFLWRDGGNPLPQYAFSTLAIFSVQIKMHHWACYCRIQISLYLIFCHFIQRFLAHYIPECGLMKRFDTRMGA